MIGNPLAHNLVEGQHARHGVPFLASHRALTVCTRELAHLGDEVVRATLPVHGAPEAERPTVRRSPERCIVQLGPVALTIAWLRGNNNTVADGELLVIVWRGAVAPRNRHQPERPATGPAPLGATPLWEEVLVPVGDSAETWAWRLRDGHELARCSSSELAARCAGQLRAAYSDHDAPASPDAPAPSIT